MNVYRELVKKVHPDLNGGSLDSTRKMQEVNKFRNNPDILLDLARQWGLNLDGTFNAGTFDSKARAEEVYEAVVGAIVREDFLWRGSTFRVRGVIVDARRIRKGYRTGQMSYTIYDFETRMLWVKKCPEGTLRPVGMANQEDISVGMESLDRRKEARREVTKAKKAQATASFGSLGLRPNKNYSYDDVFVTVVSKRFGCRRYRLLRTAGRSVYVDFYGREKRMSLGNVINVTY